MAKTLITAQIVNFQALNALIRIWSFFKLPSKQNFGKLPS